MKFHSIGQPKSIATLPQLDFLGANAGTGGDAGRYMAASGVLKIFCSLCQLSRLGSRTSDVTVVSFFTRILGSDSCRLRGRNELNNLDDLDQWCGFLANCSVTGSVDSV